MPTSAENELFRGYETDYIELSNQMKRQLVQIKNQTGEQRKRTYQQIHKDIENAERLIKNMEYEANSIVAREVRERLLQKMKNIKNDVANLRSELSQYGGGGMASERDHLLGGKSGKDEFQIANEDYRSRLISSSRALERTNDSLARSQQLMEETEQIGIEVASDVRRQGEQLRSTRDRLQDANQQLSLSSRIIGRMSRRQITNRIILILIILIMLAVIGVILYFIIKPLIPKPTPPAPAPAPAPTSLRL
jgi:vesicle transport through interaction with t-SNAREs protein 1